MAAQSKKCQMTVKLKECRKQKKVMTKPHLTKWIDDTVRDRESACDQERGEKNYLSRCESTPSPSDRKKLCRRNHTCHGACSHQQTAWAQGLRVTICNNTLSVRDGGQHPEGPTNRHSNYTISYLERHQNIWRPGHRSCYEEVEAASRDDVHGTKKL